MSMKQSVIICLKKYFVFSGRATRSEFFWFILATFLLSISLVGIITVLNLPSEYASLVMFAISLLVFMPSVAVTIRRTHDLGYSGWAAFLYYVLAQLFTTIYNIAPTLGIHIIKQSPIDNLLASINAALFLIPVFIFAQKGSIGRNKYGPDPLDKIPDPDHWNRDL